MRRLFAALGLLAVLGASGCASGGKADIATLASNSDQVIWEAGQKAVEKRNWEAARQYFKRIIDGFPQSELGPAARLALADGYFKQGGTANEVLAISGYRDFVTLYPQHPKGDYAQFQIGEAYFVQRNSSDRDQTPTIHALEEYDRLLDAYPSSPYVEKARPHISACRQSLARADFQVGYFYQHTRRIYRAAINRYQSILNDYGDYDALDEVLYRLGQCLTLAGRAAEALPHLQKLLDTYPESRWARPSQDLMAQIAKAPSPPPKAPSPSPQPSPGATSEAPAPGPSVTPSPSPSPVEKR